jgi:TPR repeat protein
MTIRLQLVLLTAFCAAAFASIAAQTVDISELQRKATAGDAKAQFDLASAFAQGTGVPKDSAKAVEWLRKSASQGYAGAELTFGILYENGTLGVSKDPHQAAEWYMKAAKQSGKDAKHAQTAQSHLLDMLTQGLISAKEADWQPSEQSSKQAKPAKTNKGSPFSLGEVETGLTGGITSKRMSTLVTTYGVDFSLSATSKKRLTNDGADDKLLQTIASSKH